MTVRLRGSAGQSLGAFAVHGLKLEVFGDANDYVGKGLSGGTIVVRPAPSSRWCWHDNTIIGNTVLYGATAASCSPPARPASASPCATPAPTTVVEGCGANGCEYMTGGSAVILGGRRQFRRRHDRRHGLRLRPDGTFEQRVNDETVVWQRIESLYWEGVLKDLRRGHARLTQSKFAEKLLVDWELELGKFWQIAPKEMLQRLPQPLSDAPAVAAAGDDD